MKNTILRILIGAILFSLISGIVVLIIGLMYGWKTSTQFSDGFFWAGVIMIAIGFVSLQGYRQRTIDWPPLHLDPPERAKLWAADTFHGKILVAVFGISGLLLFGLSILISRLFQPATDNELTIPTAGQYRLHLTAFGAGMRRLVCKALFRSPHLAKRNVGTTILTAVGMFGEGGGWRITIPLCTLGVTLGGIVQRPAWIDGRLEARKYLCVTLSFDHDIVDGGPATRFAQHFKELLASGYGLVG